MMAMINQEKGNHNSKQQLQDHSERGKKEDTEGKKGERNRSQRQVWENGKLIKYDDGMYFDETIPSMIMQIDSLKRKLSDSVVGSMNKNENICDEKETENKFNRRRR